ncbi:MAG: NADPH-dependent FMN reductase [Vicingaceae bacterium]
MNILCISGSASPNSGNYYLLKAIANFVKEQHEVDVYQGLYEWELFTPQKLRTDIPEKIVALKQKIIAADAIFISTPEYTHNIPAVLKNLIEWCTASGEFSGKKIVAITFTPHEPRGEHAMKSLIASLKALEAKVVAQFPLYKTDVDIQDHKIELKEEQKEMLQAVFEML